MATAQAVTTRLEERDNGGAREATWAQARSDFWPDHSRGLLIAVIALAAALRAWRLLSLLPIMIDETIYLRWAEIIDHQHQMFISLLDGKTPLSFWILAVARILLNGHPLLSARLVSVLCGTLSTWLLFAIGARVAGPVAAFTTSALYALLPFGLFYDRIAYTDTYVNLAGLALAYVSLALLRRANPSALAGIAIGLTLGLGYLVKPTTGLLAGIPVGVAVAIHGREWRTTRRALFIAAVVAAMFPLLCELVRPNGPLPPETSVLLHRTSFFTPLGVLLRQPSINLPTNLELLWEYIRAYLTVPLALGALVCAFFPVRQRALVLSLLLAGCIVPIAVQVTMLRWFPSRYVFPHVWPCLLLIGVAAAWLHEKNYRPTTQMPCLALAGLISVTLVVHAAGFLIRPAAWMQAHDAEEHLGSGPFSGVGVLPAVRFLQAQASRGGYTLLTDPIIGPPADAMYPYLNQWHGVRVYDAWWMQLYDAYPILPTEPKLVAKSQYERVPAGVVDFPSLPRVFYVTASNYNTPEQVMTRQPSARLLVRFPRPNGKEFVDVYQLR